MTRKKAGGLPPAAAEASVNCDVLPADSVYIDRAIELIAARLACREGAAVKALLGALHDGDLRSWIRGAPRESIARAVWANAHVDLEAFRTGDSRANAIQFGGKVYHLYRFLISRDDLIGWLDRKESDAGSVRQSAAATVATPKGLPPPGELMTACEVLTWLAFGKPARKEDSDLGATWFHDRWGYSGLGPVLHAIELRAAGKALPVLPSDRPGAFQHELFSPNSDEKMLALQRRVDARERRVVAWGEMATMLRADMRRDAERAGRLKKATAALLGALRTGKIVARAPGSNGVPMPIPEAVFQHPAVTVDLFDKVTVDCERPMNEWADYHGPTFRDVRFLSRDVAASKLKPIPATPNLVRAQQWMREHVKPDVSGKAPKREFAIKDCMTATGCNTQEARSAYNTDAPVKRRRGQH